LHELEQLPIDIEAIEGSNLRAGIQIRRINIAGCREIMRIEGYIRADIYAQLGALLSLKKIVNLLENLPVSPFLPNLFQPDTMVVVGFT